MPKPKHALPPFTWDLLPRFWDRAGRISHALHVKNPDLSMDTDDIRNEGLGRIYQTNGGSWENEEYLATIFHVAAYHAVVDKARKNGRRVDEVPMDTAASRQAFNEATAPNIAVLREALDEVRVRHPNWGMVMEAVHFVGEDYATIAARAGVTVDTIGDWKKCGQMAVRDIIRQIEAGTFKPWPRKKARNAS